MRTLTARASAPTQSPILNELGRKEGEKPRPGGARDVQAGGRWIFRDHRSMAAAPSARC